ELEGRKRRFELVAGDAQEGIHLGLGLAQRQLARPRLLSLLFQSLLYGDIFELAYAIEEGPGVVAYDPDSDPRPDEVSSLVEVALRHLKAVDFALQGPLEQRQVGREIFRIGEIHERVRAQLDHRIAQHLDQTLIDL